MLRKISSFGKKTEDYLDLGEAQSGQNSCDFHSAGKYKCFKKKRKAKKTGLITILRTIDRGIFAKKKTGNLDPGKFKILSRMIDKLREKE